MLQITPSRHPQVRFGGHLDFNALNAEAYPLFQNPDLMVMKKPEMLFKLLRGLDVHSLDMLEWLDKSLLQVDSSKTLQDGKYRVHPLLLLASTIADNEPGFMYTGFFGERNQVTEFDLTSIRNRFPQLYRALTVASPDSKEVLAYFQRAHKTNSPVLAQVIGVVANHVHNYRVSDDGNKLLLNLPHRRHPGEKQATL